MYTKTGTTEFMLSNIKDTIPQQLGPIQLSIIDKRGYVVRIIIVFALFHFICRLDLFDMTFECSTHY